MNLYLTDSNKVYFLPSGKILTHSVQKNLLRGNKNTQRTHTKCPLQFISIQFKYVYFFAKILGIHHLHSQSYTNLTQYYRLFQSKSSVSSSCGNWVGVQVTFQPASTLKRTCFRNLSFSSNKSIHYTSDDLGPTNHE